MLVYVRIELSGNVTEYKSTSLDDFNQTCAVKVRLHGNSDLTLVLLYRPHHVYRDKVAQPDLTARNNVKLCDMLHLIPKPFFIVGDLNYSNIDWETKSSDGTGCVEFLQAMQDNFMSQHIDFSTHSSGTQPDVVLSSNSENVLDVQELCRLSSSDHSAMMVTLVGKVSRNTTFEEVSDWRNADLELLRNELASVDWQLDSQDVLEAWNAVKQAAT